MDPNGQCFTKKGKLDQTMLAKYARQNSTVPALAQRYALTNAMVNRTASRH